MTVYNLIGDTFKEVKPASITEDMVKNGEKNLATNEFADIPATTNTKLLEVYNANKPIIESTDTYRLAICAIEERDGSYSGIINCFVNEDFKQIRF